MTNINQIVYSTLNTRPDGPDRRTIYTDSRFWPNWNDVSDDKKMKWLEYLNLLVCIILVKKYAVAHGRVMADM